MTKSKRLAWLSYAFCGLFPVLVFFSRCRGNWSFDMPSGYGGDMLGLVSFIKTLIHGDWWPFFGVHSESLGAPFGGYDLGDYPTPEQLQALILKIIGFFSINPFWVMNVYFLLSFAMIGLAARWAFRRIGVSVGMATVAACLYSLLPFHFIRHGHLLLANYAVLPLTLPPLLWMWGRKPIFFRREGTQLKLDFCSRRARITLLVAALTGTWHIYYAFFFAGFLVVAGVSAALSRRSWPHALSAALAVATVTASLSVVLAPNIIYRKRHPPNTERVAVRNSWEVEQWALQLTNLTLPPGDHRVKAFRKAKARYHPWPNIVEGWDEYIGTFGVFGLGVLFIAGMSLRRRDSTILKLTVLTVAGILFATRSGFGSHFSSFVSPQMRSLNRISVYLGLFAFAATALWLRSRTFVRQKWVQGTFLVALLAWGVHDQVSPGFVYTDSLREPFEADRNFIAEIEEKVPAGTVVFQLPYLAFPEAAPIAGLGEYAHFRAYVHSKTLRWSYAAMKGRPAAERIEALSKELDPAKLREAGYGGIYVDRAGYVDKGAALEADLRKRLKQEPIVSRNGRLVFFKL